jgi:sigma-E factor negative regulatory protein RseB
MGSSARHVLATFAYLIAVLGLLGVGSGTVSAQAKAEAQAMQRIERMVEAARKLSYDATFVYSHGKQMDEMRIIHRYQNGAEQERLVTLSGSTREVLRDNSRVTCIIPDNQSVVVGKSRPQTVYGSPLLTARGYMSHYRLTMGGDARVAGRRAEIVAVTPRDEFRYGYRLWVDNISGLLLRSELIGEEGAVLESIIYTSLTVSESIPDDLLEPEITGKGFTWYTTEEGTAQTLPKEAGWEARWLPPGFSMRDQQSGPLPAGRMPIEHIVYGDGLASLSIYIEKLPTDAHALEGISKMGAMSAFGTMHGEYQITVVGEVPEQTVKLVGDSVSKRP